MLADGNYGAFSSPIDYGPKGTPTLLPLNSASLWYVWAIVNQGN
jgi:hypothetical protein